MSGLVTAEEALAFVEEQGVVLVSAKGSAPSLVEAIVGHPVRGSWWGHAQGKRIFALLTAVTASEHVLVCRLLDGKLTLVHRRLWPALVRVAHDVGVERLAQVRQEHTVSGRHANHAIAFPRWVPAAIAEAAEALDEQESLAALAGWLPLATKPDRSSGRKS
jgi:hypothetical protein